MQGYKGVKGLGELCSPGGIGCRGIEVWGIETSGNLKRPGNLIHGIVIKTAHKTDNSVLGLGFLEVVRVDNVEECGGQGV